MTKRYKPNLAGQILSNDQRETIAIVGETLAEALDINTWGVVEDTIPQRTPHEQARMLVETDALLKSITKSRK